MDYFHRRVFQGMGKDTLPTLCSLVALGVDALWECILQAGIDGRESHRLLMHLTARIPAWQQRTEHSKHSPLKSSLPPAHHLLHCTENSAWRISAGPTGNLFLQHPGSHLLSALVRFPVHSFTSSGHSQGHSHSFCSILQGRKHRESHQTPPGF